MVSAPSMPAISCEGESQWVQVAVVQSCPVVFDGPESTCKACRLVAEAVAKMDEATGGSSPARSSESGSSSVKNRLVVFPESYIPAYPRGLSFGAVVGSRTAEGKTTFEEYWRNSITVPGPETEALGRAALESSVWLVIGVTERFSKGTLYCSVLTFGPDGILKAVHRKLKPTGSERLIWADGDGSSLNVVTTPFGVIGSLICWENYMPLARMALYSQGIDIYIAPTADSRDAWQSTMQHISLEGRCYVIGCNQFVKLSDYPEHLQSQIVLPSKVVSAPSTTTPTSTTTNTPVNSSIIVTPQEPDRDTVLCRGGSVVLSPHGEILAGPLFDKEGILVTQFNMSEITRARYEFDPVGHYSKPEVFSLTVDVKSHTPVTKATGSTS
ncbi:carbon-nitrogen hydrolase family protein [Pelomyxa schiedti]|nr:carbon-nitrogen hydrolase family protein [Pelomyxa schiedti]